MPADPAAAVWLREVGVLILALAVVHFAVRRHPPSLRVILLGSAVVQAGMLPIELVAGVCGTLPRAAGFVPNTVLHGVLAAGFVWYFARCRPVSTARP